MLRGSSWQRLSRSEGPVPAASRPRSATRRRLGGRWLVLLASSCSGGSAAPAPDAAGSPDAAVTSCIDDKAAGLHTYTCGAAAIAFTVSVPARCLGEACGLILDVHGGFSSADEEDAHTHLRALGEAHGYVVVQPTAPQGRWSASGEDDDAILAFTQEAVAAWGVDPRRVHMTGFSNGGFMTWRFICRHADLLASAAPAAAAYPNAQYNLTPLNGTLIGCPFTADDRPSREIDILYMHGQHDECFRFASASDGPDSAEDQRDAVLQAWGLSGHQVVASGDRYTHERYTNDRGTVFEVLFHDYAKGFQVCDSVWRPDGYQGHCIPGSTSQTGTPCLGPTDFAWGEEVVGFFDAHPRDR